MNTKLNPTWLRALCLVVAFIAAAGTQPSAHAQASPQQPYDSRLRIESIEQLAARANEVVDINVNEALMKIVGGTLGKASKDADAAKVKEIISGLKGIYVRSYGFTNEGEYSEADMTTLRAQLRSPGWLRIVNVIKKKEGQTVEVYMMTGGERVGGLAIVASEPKRLTLVNIVGMIDLEKLSQLEGQFGIPELGIEAEGRKDEREDRTDKATKKP
jgi:hypothetical protein